MQWFCFHRDHKTILFYDFLFWYILLLNLFEYLRDIIFFQKINGGTTAVCALLLPKEKTLYVAWVGDSLATLVSEGKILPCVNPHKPDREVWFLINTMERFYLYYFVWTGRAWKDRERWRNGPTLGYLEGQWTTWCFKSYRWEFFFINFLLSPIRREFGQHAQKWVALYSISETELYWGFLNILQIGI